MLSERIKSHLEESTKDTIRQVGLQAAIDTLPHYIPTLILLAKAKGWADDEKELTENQKEAEQVIASVLGMM